MDVEIGINIVAKIYLHLLDNELPTAFEVKNISNVEDTELGTTITYIEHDPSPYSSAYSSINYIVGESKEDIEKAIADAEYYRDEGLRHIQSLLD